MDRVKGVPVIPEEEELLYSPVKSKRFS